VLCVSHTEDGPNGDRNRDDSENKNNQRARRHDATPCALLDVT
jgi:hypothetical protein